MYNRKADLQIGVLGFSYKSEEVTGSESDLIVRSDELHSTLHST